MPRDLSAVGLRSNATRQFCILLAFIQRHPPFGRNSGMTRIGRHFRRHRGLLHAMQSLVEGRRLREIEGQWLGCWKTVMRGFPYLCANLAQMNRLEAGPKIFVPSSIG